MSSSADADPPDLRGGITATVLPRRHREVAKTSTTVLLASAVAVVLVVVLTVAGMISNARTNGPELPAVVATPVEQTNYTVVLNGQHGSVGPARLTVPPNWSFRKVDLREGFVGAYHAEKEIGKGIFAALLFGEPTITIRATTARMAARTFLGDALRSAYRKVNDIGNVNWQPCAQLEPVRCQRWSGTIKYAHGGGERSDEARILMYRQENDTWFVLATFVPVDAAPAVKADADAMWQSIQLPQ